MPFTMSFLTLLLLLFMGVLTTAFDIQQVYKNGLLESHGPWEYGTLFQAQLSVIGGPVSIFATSPFDFPNDRYNDDIKELKNLLDQYVPSIQNPTTAPQAFFSDGSISDPTSVGIAVILADKWTPNDPMNPYKTAVERQIAFLYAVPSSLRYNGAWSHRSERLDFWSDSIAMIPPFLAYNGAVNYDSRTLLDAYNHIKVYRENMRDPQTSLWLHSQYGDRHLWATGNGWATLGMLRVLYIWSRSSYFSVFTTERGDLVEWILEIIRAVYESQGYNKATNQLMNYLEAHDGNFPDNASTVLMAACVYRFDRYLKLFEPSASPRLSALALYMGYATQTWNSLKDMPSDWLPGVVNQWTFDSQADHSPEGQAFLMELYSAQRDSTSGIVS